MRPTIVIEKPTPEVATAWRREGWTVKDPASTAAPDYRGYVHRAIQDVLAADAIALPPGWEHHHGLVWMHAVAREFGIPVLDRDLPTQPKAVAAHG